MGFFTWLTGSATDDEPVEEQRNDISALVTRAGWRINEGCDEIPGSRGRFGLDAGNPIPVNGPIGETVYMNRLRGKSGAPFLHHRIGTVRSTAIDAVIDRFELVAIDASEWVILHFCAYFPRRSLKAPLGMSLASWRNANSAQQLMLKYRFFGRGDYVENFPLDLPRLIAADEALNSVTPGLGASMAARMQQYISAQAGKWVRPYKLDRELAGAPVPIAQSTDLIEPRRPDVTRSKPLRFFEIGNFTLALLQNPPVFTSDGSPREPIVAALVAMSSQKQLLMYTVQTCRRDRPPTICVWQLDGQYRVHDAFSEKWNDLKTFTDFALPAIRKELGLEHITIVERFTK